MPQDEVKKKVPPRTQYYDEWPNKPLIMPHGGAPVPPTKLYPRPPLGQPEITMQARPPYAGPGEIQAGQAQAQDIARRTNAAQQNAWNQSMRQPTSPLEMFSAAPPGTNDPTYAIQGLQGRDAEQQRRMGQAATELTQPQMPEIPPSRQPFVPISNADNQMRSFKRGGTVPRTGTYKLHAGEKVIPSRMAKRFGEAQCG